MKHLIRHGMSYTPTYNSWSSMIQRCNDPKTINFDKYGGKGIKVIKSWLDFNNFYKDMGTRPDGMTLDRINGDEGYYKNNCRWADLSTQSYNQTWKKISKSGYVGVYHRKDRFRNKPFKTVTTILGTYYPLGNYETAEEAAIAYDCAMIQLRGKEAKTNIL